MAFLGALAWRFPFLRDTLDEHLSDNDGEVLPHPLMSEYERWAERALQASDPQLSDFLGALEDAYRSGSDIVEELVSVSFLEHVPRLQEPGSELRDLVGPALRRQLGVIEDEASGGPFLVELTRDRSESLSSRFGGEISGLPPEAGVPAGVTAGELVDAKDRWLVPLDGCVVVQCRIDHAFTLVIGSGPGSFEVRIEQPFEVLGWVDGGQPVSLSLEDEDGPSALAPALSVLHAALEAALAFKDGRLELWFADGRWLRVPAVEQFEAWTLVGPDGLRLVSLPGGEVAVWSPQPRR
ncbi:MAG: YtzH-like family protein [Solirubrobacteraceae bacterium MAG38_C4-C5]|nr:YtzH-like family protein [Candidatus Siliceabacter maunaloa]